MGSLYLCLRLNGFIFTLCATGTPDILIDVCLFVGSPRFTVTY